MSTTVAIVFGLSRYWENRFPPLPAAQIDARFFARALQHWGVDDVTLFLNEDATVENLRQWLASIAKKGSDVKLVFYFCGHGKRDAEVIPNSHLLFFDDRLNLDSLMTSICQLEVEESYVFIDACSLRINSILNPKLHGELKGNKNSRKSLFCLLSSGIEESFENNRYGYFTDALLRTLSRFRKTSVDPSQLHREICGILEKDGLPLPEMYNFENQQISFLPHSPPFFENDGWIRQTEMIAKIEDALIEHRGKVGVLIGEKGSGKTALCRFLTPVDNLVLIDGAESLSTERLCQFVQEGVHSQSQFLLLANRNIIDDLSPSLQKHVFLIEMDPFSPEKGKKLLQPYRLKEHEESLVYLVSKGNPSKMQHIARQLGGDLNEEDGKEKEEVSQVIHALYACGCYLDKELFIEVFSLSPSAVALLEEMGLVRFENDSNAWAPHPIFYEIADAESHSFFIEKEKVLEYWFRQIKQSSDAIRAAEAMAEASPLLAEIYPKLQSLDWEEKLRRAKPLRRKKPIILGSVSLLLALSGTIIYQSIVTVSPQFVNLKQIHPDFVGRGQYIHDLQTMCLKWDHAPSTAVLWGEAGIGKSEIAIAFANQNAKKFRLIGWIDCGTEESYSASYYALAKFLQIPVEQEKDLVKKVHEHLGASHQPWLLILDNLEQKRELPTKGKGSIIVTTRDRTPWHAQSCIHVAPFQEKEAIALLKKITNNSDSSQIVSLVKELDFFPLTLNLAAHYIADTPEMNEEVYLKLLTQNNIDLISSMPLDDRYANSLLSSWNIKADELAENEPEILQWLHFCSCLCPSGIPAVWIEKWLTDIRQINDPFQVKIRSAAILRALTNQCLIRYEKPTHTLCLHLLRHDVMKKDRHFQKATIEQAGQFLISCAENIEKIYEKEKHLSQWATLREWEPHAAWFINNYGALCTQETRTSLMNLLGNWKYIKGDYKVAQNYHEQVLRNRISLYGEDHPKTITSMNNLATILWENGQFIESKNLFFRALNASKKLYKDDHLDVIVTLNNLGWVSWEMGQFQEAKALLNQSLYVSNKLRACDPDFLQTANDFIQFLDEANEKKASSDLEKATKRALFLRHAGLWIAEVEGNPKKSLNYFKQSLEVLKQTVPKEDPRIAKAYGSLGISYNRAGQSKEGKRYLAKALKIQRKILGDEHPETAKSYANLAISYVNLGKFRKALDYHLKALDIRRKSLGEEHPITAKSYSGTGMALLGLGKYKKSLSYNQKALDIRIKVLGENHSETAQSYSRLGLNFGKLGDHEKALDYNLKALHILETIFGDSHYLTANVHIALGTCYRNLSRLEKAMHHEQKAQEIRSNF